MRIACWSGPRNLSTALMRAWENRADTAVIDEPLYAFYLDRTGLEHPVRERVLASQPTDWRVVADGLTGPIPEGASIYYQKHMAHHLLDEVGRDWLASLTHVLLIRDPAAVIASYTRARGECTLDDLGYPQQLALRDWLRAHLGVAVPVVDRTRLLADPRGQLTALCERLGVVFDEAMLAWPEGPRDSDGVWADHWYASVRASTGFAPDRSPANPEVAERYLPVLEQARPIYDALLADAL